MHGVRFYYADRPNAYDLWSWLILAADGTTSTSPTPVYPFFSVVHADQFKDRCPDGAQSIEVVQEAKI